MEMEELEEEEAIEHIACLNCNERITLVNSNPSICPNCLWVNVLLPERTFKKLIKEKGTLERITFDPIYYKSEDYYVADLTHFTFPIFLKKDLEDLKIRAKSTCEALEMFIKEGKSELSENSYARLKQFKDHFSENELRDKIRYYRARLKALKFLNRGNFIERDYDAITGKQKEEIYEKYKNGTSIEDLTKEYSRSKYSIYRYINQIENKK